MKTHLFFLWTICFFMLLFACQDPCEEVECLNGGTCVEGSCECPDGFIGLNCEIKIDPCEIKQCVNADTCLVNAQGEARCFCSDGFEGERCDSTFSDKYVGTFDVTESCIASNFFEVQIEKGPRFNEFTVINFNDQAVRGESRVVVEAINRTALNIRRQFMEFGEVSGQGGLQSYNIFTLDYTVINQNDTLPCSAVFERKF